MKQKFSSELCNNKMTFQDCELAILRHAVDEAEKINSSKLANSDSVKRMISILEDFLIKTKCICYGGTLLIIYCPKMLNFMIEKSKFRIMIFIPQKLWSCLLYTSDAADE